MSVKDAYNNWAEIYDSNENATRDAEHIVLKEMLNGKQFNRSLEIGCGTGKNTAFLSSISGHVTAVDFSEQMIGKAKEKQYPSSVGFLLGDIQGEWSFASGTYDLITFSLVLEHIEHLAPVFEKANNVLSNGGIVYIGELHPYKQYAGSKARFETQAGVQVLECYTHQVSEFLQPTIELRLTLNKIIEHKPEGEPLPRILGLLISK
jgi:ubiquinone/menaquinone biosynthesis C-methylase UbiE